MDKIRKEAYSIVFNVLKNNHRSEMLLEKAAAKIVDDRDKALLYHIVRGVLKMLLNLDYIAERLCDREKYRKTDRKIKILLWIGLYQLIYCSQIPDHSAINETVEVAKELYDKKIADYVNAVLREYQRNSEVVYPEQAIENLSAKYSFPEELIRTWSNYWSIEEVEVLCRYFNEPAKLSIRINQLATNKKRLLKYFEKKEIPVNEVDLSANILITDEVEKTLNDVSFAEGYVSVQDASAAMVVELFDPQPEESILDLFAGPGGKCTYIAELMNNTGEIIAVDRYPKKVKKIKQALHRLQINNTTTIVEDALKYGPRAPAFDRVILDVPCTGWGVLQKKAELRWQAKQDIKSLLKLQEQALGVGAYFVKPGGILLYSTCTMNPDENEAQVEKFLTSNKDFQLMRAADFIPQRYTKNNCLYTIPHRDNVDGAFAAKMRKDAKKT